MDRSVLVVIIVLAISIIGSFPASEISGKKEKILGGITARIFHHLGVGAYIGVAPAALLGSLLVGPLKFGIPLAFSFLAIAFLMLLLYGVVEHSARKGIEIDEHLWTQQDAKSSRL